MSGSDPGHGEYGPSAGGSRPPGAAVPPPGGERSRSRGRLPAVIVTLVVLLAGGGLLAYHVNSSDTDFYRDPATSAAALPQSPQAARYGIAGRRGQLWSTQVSNDQEADHRASHDRGDLLIGAGVVAYAAASRLTGYAEATGTKLWSLTIGPGLRPCAPPATEGATGAVLYARSGPADTPCDQVVAVDLKSGRELWRHEATDTPDAADAGDAGNPSPTAAVGIGQGVVVATADHAPVAFDAATGRKLWTGATQHQVDGFARGLAHLAVQGGQVVSLYKGGFAEDGQDPRSLVVVHGIKDGRTLGKFAGPALPQRNPTSLQMRVVHADPLVISPDVDGTVDDGRYYAHAGDAWTRVRTDSVTQDADPGSMVREDSSTSDDRNVVVTGDTLVSSYFYPQGESNTAVVAFDLASGKKRWEYHLEPGADAVVFFPAQTGNTVRALVYAGGSPVQLYAFPVTGGTPVPGGEAREPKHANTSYTRGPYTYAVLDGDRLVTLDEGVHDGAGPERDAGAALTVYGPKSKPRS